MTNLPDRYEKSVMTNIWETFWNMRLHSNLADDCGNCLRKKERILDYRDGPHSDKYIADIISEYDKDPYKDDIILLILWYSHESNFT